eukprot:TRINITY_DN14006_c0_g1_i2.p1 TRINITY_DN14006_c0_g1~~TRINITY_DN14006_c0_g1_i2.p1  ORF type:complete len:268 (-),score=47.73 TRINITY_DN14006_c0_g1_i2:133-936(-)
MSNLNLMIFFFAVQQTVLVMCANLLSATYTSHETFLSGYTEKHAVVEITYDEDLFYGSGWACGCMQTICTEGNQLLRVDEGHHNFTILEEGADWVQTTVPFGGLQYFKFYFPPDRPGCRAVILYHQNVMGYTLVSLSTSYVPSTGHATWQKHEFTASDSIWICPDHPGWRRGWWYLVITHRFPVSSQISYLLKWNTRSVSFIPCGFDLFLSLSSGINAEYGRKKKKKSELVYFHLSCLFGLEISVKSREDEVTRKKISEISENCTFH